MAKSLVNAGARVALWQRGLRNRLMNWRRLSKRQGGEVFAVPSDVTSPHDRLRLVETAVADLWRA
jgi:NAD(P)-dependent dehydrogenase (short-subunit alcohol dehydrogenase family)